MKAALECNEADYRAIYERFYQRLIAAGQPVTTWTTLTCQGKFYLPSNDFSIMVSRAMFEAFFLPAVIRECQYLDRALYHLDGPGALRHLDCLLAIPELEAIQFSPGDGKDGFAHWVEVYQRIQRAGKGLQVNCRLEEVDQVIEALRPEGVYLVVQDVGIEEQAEMLLHKLSRWPLRGF